MRSAAALAGWGALGVAAAFATVEVGALGLALIAVLFLILPGWRDAGAVFAGASALPFWVAYVNRAGAGMECHAVANGVECGEQLNPWPWLGAGVALCAFALASCVLVLRRSA